MKGTFEPDGPLWEPVMVRLELAFMLEVDSGEMPVERYKNAQRTYFAKKMLTYYEANRQCGRGNFPDVAGGGVRGRQLAVVRQDREPPRTTGSDVVRERLVELQLTILPSSLASVAN